MSETDLSISHPQISSLYDLYLLETQPFRKVHRMIDLFETIIKMHTVVIMGEYFKRNELSEMAKGMLAYGLQTPSLGTWQKFSRDLCSELVCNNHLFVLNYFKDEFLLFDKANNDKTNIISFRNRYAHGATPTDNDCEADIIQFEPFLLKLLASKWLYESQLIIIDNLVFIQSKTTLEKLNLHPILVCKEEINGQPFTFFNDIKDDKVGLLNYPLSKHYREQKTYIEEFYAVLPLKEWKQNVSNEFKQYIEELTEGFKGRIMELKAISTFISTKEKGYLSIQGNPGIGKSALIAQVSRELNKSEYNKKYKLCEYFIRRGTRSDNNINLLNHLLKTTDIYYPEGKSIMPEGNSNWDLQKALFAKWNAFGNGGPKFKLIFLIDGLDEGVVNDILNYLPRENFKNILFIYGSRHGGHLKLASFWTELPIENHETILLGGLNKEDIRAFLYEVVNKYEIDQIWIDEILNRSEGNPLYLKLLCNALENGSIAMNNSKALPKEIDSYYKAILDRYAQQTDGDALFECLLLFAVAEDYLTPAHLGIMNSMSIASQQRVMNILTEVLYENPQTDFVLDYQLFHESFREYLIKTYPLEIKKANQKIIDSCQKWQELETLFEQRYILEHYATHLVKSATVENKEVLVELSKNAAFQKTQNQVLRNYNANYSLLRAALLAASELNQKEDVIEIGLCLVDLQYEEKNDVQSIIDMVANNEMELAIQRIKNYVGSGKDDRERQFLLIMFCLMELTLLDSKDKNHKKEGVEALLKFLFDEIPVDSIHRKIFSSYLVFLISVEIKKIDLDFSELIKKFQDLDFYWIKDSESYSDIQIEVILDIIQLVSLDSKSKAINKITINLAKKGLIEKAVKILDETSDNKYNKCFALKEIAEIVLKQGNIEYSTILIEYSIETAHVIYENWNKSKAFAEISLVLFKQGKLEKAKNMLQLAIQLTDEIIDEESKNYSLLTIIQCLIKQNLLDIAYNIIPKITIELYKYSGLLEITNYLKVCGNLNNAEKIMQQTLLSEKNIKIKARNDVFLLENIIFKQLIVFEGIEKCIDIINKIDSSAYKFKSFLLLSNYLFETGIKEKSDEIINQLITESFNSFTEDSKSNSLLEITKILCIQGKLAQAKFINSGILDSLLKKKANKYILELNYLLYVEKKLKFKSTDFLLFTTEILIHKKHNVLLDLVDYFNSKLDYSKSQIVLNEYSDRRFKNLGFRRIIRSLCENDKIEVALGQIKKIYGIDFKIEAYVMISKAMFKNGLIEKAGQLLLKAIEINEKLDEDAFNKTNNYKKISIGFIGIKDFEGAINIENKIKESEKNRYKNEISLEIVSAFVNNKLNEAISITNEISDDDMKILAFINISNYLASQGNKAKSEEIIQQAITISKKINSISAFISIFDCIASQGNILNAMEIVQQAINVNQSNIYFKNRANQLISESLVKHFNYELAIETIQKNSDDNDRIEFWRMFGRELYKEKSMPLCISQLKTLPNEEAVFFYKRGMAEAITATNASNVLELLELVNEDTKSIAHILQMHALYLCFFENTNPIKIQRFNKTLNIQWALDIAAKFEKEFERASHNVQEWINEIEDENDREDVLSWAEKVEQGKMTEEKFLERINKL